MALYHQLSTWIVDKYFQDEELEAEKRAYVLYYLENILAGTEKILLVLVSACLLSVLAETAAILLSYTVVRRKSFGWHARKSHHCTWVSLLTFVFVPWLLKEVEWNRIFLATLCLLSVILIARYAPADTECNPLVDPKFRRACRLQAIFLSIVFVFVAIALDFYPWLIFGLFLEAVVITPVFYSIMRRSYANYEQYQEY
ncbi:accessory gene regulator AgrB [Paenibacillus sp. LX16]|uniref:accessory gene regulator AgrB n=1 Tax=Paenibacillus sp. LX16 TaxID=1740264 RepID=UPI002E2BD851|nr:accessory gene regulator AgrB [Paenibacillus sp. LX16]